MIDTTLKVSFDNYGSIRTLNKVYSILIQENITRRLSHYVVFECRTELRGPIRHLSGKIC